VKLRHKVGRNARVRVTEVLRVPRGFRFARAKAAVTRVLYEPRGRKELAGPAPFVSRPADRRRAQRSVRRPRPRVRLRRLGPTRLAVDIRKRGKGLRVPRACEELPPSLQPRNRILTLENRLRLSDGRRPSTRVIRRSWRCERDRRGNVVRLRAVRRRVRHRLLPGLRSVLRLSGTVRPGGTALARLEVRNARRAGPGSTLWPST
jgi:hypothetical protein